MTDKLKCSRFFAKPANLHQAGILSMNARNLNYISRYNPRHLLPMVDNKLTTKRLAEKAGVAVPKLIGVVRFPSDIKNLAGLLTELDDFVIKPSSGSGGKGILVIIHRDGKDYIKANGDRLTQADISRHVSNILSGLYSLGGKQMWP